MSTEGRAAGPTLDRHAHHGYRSWLARWAARQVLRQSYDQAVRRTYEAEAVLGTNQRHSPVVRWAARQVIYEIYDQTVMRIYTFCLAHTGTREQAERLTAETFAEALESIVDGHVPQPGRAYAWLLRIAAAFLMPQAAAHAERLVENWERADLLRERLKTLPSARNRNLQVPSLEGLRPQQLAAQPALSEQEAWQLLGSIGITPASGQRLLGAVPVRDLGPLLLAQERAEESPPDPGFVQNVRRWLATTGRRRGLERALWSRVRRWTLSTSLLIAVWALLVVSVHVLSRHPSGHAAPLWSSPPLIASTLTRNYPSPFEADLHTTSPTMSSLDPPSGAPFLGKLQLSAKVNTLAGSATLLPVFQLQGHQSDMRLCERLAGLAGIRSGVSTRAGGGSLWYIAIDGAGTSSRSLAVSAVTGEIIYHGVPGSGTATPRFGTDPRVHAVARARSWLTRLGWPGATMPLRSVGSGPAGSEVVAFGWPGIGATDTSAATLQIGADQAVVDARLWPLVALSGAVRVRDIAAAWQDLRHGTTPVAVENLVVGAGTQLDGTVKQVTVVHVLSARADGSLYLVPAYRFEGTARLQAAGLAAGASAESVTTHWYALVAAQT